jgi:hypothetical protein
MARRRKTQRDLELAEMTVQRARLADHLRRLDDSIAREREILERKTL